MNEETAWVLILLIVTCGFVANEIINSKYTPYEQTYEYLFNSVDSMPNNIMRVEYYNRTYVVVPLLDKDCLIDNYLLIEQTCIKDEIKVNGEEK